MDDADLLTDFHVRVARTFFSLSASAGYVVAGGAGLLASDLISRRTEDLDLFASVPVTSVVEVKNEFVGVLQDSGHDVTVLQDSPTFCRMVVGLDDSEMLVDLAIDAPPMGSPSMTVLGPTLAPLDLAGRKLLALFGRAEARDFADVYVLAQRFGKSALLDQARSIDAGFDPRVLAQMMETLGRFADDEIPLASTVVRSRESTSVLGRGVAVVADRHSAAVALTARSTASTTARREVTVVGVGR